MYIYIYTVTHTGDTTCLLLDAKANIDAVNDDRRSALHFATWNCHPRTVLLLLQYGADMSLSGEDGVMASDVSAA